MENDSNWDAHNLEYDLLLSDWILNKVRKNDVYAQNLYAALCQNEFKKLEIFSLLKGDTWSCSWRYAGGIIANMRHRGAYTDWYCSGCWEISDDQTFNNGYITEGVVTDEIREDLKQLGWIVVDPTDLL